MARVVERPAESQFHAVFPKLVSDGAGIRDGPGRTVEFRHDQRVAFAHGTEGLVEAGAGTGRAGEAVTSLDAILGDRIQPVGGTAFVCLWQNTMLWRPLAGIRKMLGNKTENPHCRGTGASRQGADSGGWGSKSFLSQRCGNPRQPSRRLPLRIGIVVSSV